MNMSNTHSTRKSSYSHLSATERGEIAAYLKMGKKPISAPISLIVDNVSMKPIVKSVLISS